MDYEKKDIIRESKQLYGDINSCITDLVNARIAKDLYKEGRAIFRMDGLMVATMQHLGCVIDFLEKQKEPVVDKEGMYYYLGGKFIYCGYPATEENPYDFVINQQEGKQKECVADSSKTSESEDERIRKVIYKLMLGMRKEIFTSQDEIVTKEKALAYLEKKPDIKIWPHPIKDVYLEQKEQKDFQAKVEQRMKYLWDKLPNAHKVEEGNCTPEEWKTLGAYMELEMNFDKCVENCDPKTVEEVNKRVDDIMNMSELSAFEQALTNFIGDWEDDEERWPSKFVKKHGRHILDMAREELQKEQKPILEVFGFKVGDAVRLKDGDGRKHIIKSFEEVEGLHGPNFYHVEFEDNSARDSIYPGEEYPNGYYTQMEKFEKEQKPIAESKRLANEVIEYLTRCGYSPVLKDDSKKEHFHIDIPRHEDDFWQSEEYKHCRNVLGEYYMEGDYGSDTYTLYIWRTKKEQKPEGVYVDCTEHPEWYGMPTKEQKPAECTDDVVEEAENYTSKVACGEYGIAVTEAYIAGVLSERTRERKWSEEDEKHINNILDIIDYWKATMHFVSYQGCTIDADIAWLKSLRPSWKPSEEQMKALQRAIDACESEWVYKDDELRSLLNELKKL